MIRTLRGKLIAAAMASLVLVMGGILGGILLANYRGLIYDADRILALLAENQGRFPELKIDFDWENLGPRRQSPELRYELRYFSVLLDATGELVTVDTGKIAAVDQETAVQWAKEVMAREKEKGFYGTYRYLVSQEGEEQRILFLDDSSHLFICSVGKIPWSPAYGSQRWGCWGSCCCCSFSLAGSSSRFWRDMKSSGGSSRMPAMS